MCFDSEYEWTASLCEEDSGPAVKPCKCDECGHKISAGEWRHHIYQQEHETCYCCEEDGVDPCECETPDLGETYDYQRCEACDKLLRAVEQHEIDEGCPVYARRPALTELHDVFWQHEQNWEYAEKAVAMFPELIDHRFIAELLMEVD